MRDSIEEDAMMEFFLPDFIECVIRSKVITPKEGVTHAKDGAFVQWLRDAKEEGLLEKDDDLFLNEPVDDKKVIKRKRKTTDDDRDTKRAKVSP
jgi:hypothetical protein